MNDYIATYQSTNNMNTEKPLVNRVANSGLITLNLETYFPKEAVVEFDLKDYLYMELILKEKEFRAALKAHDWSQYEGKHLAIHCSTDAIVPTWAYMLVTVYATPHALNIIQGSAETFYATYYQKILSEIDVTQYADQRIVIKGCSNKPVPVAAYTELVRLLQPHAKSIMYGEPCSTVPIYKKPRLMK